MKRPKLGIAVLRPLILGILVGGLGTTCFLFSADLTQRDLASFLQTVLWPNNKSHNGNGALPQQQVTQGDRLRDLPLVPDVPSRWCYIKVDATGWSATSADNLLQLQERIDPTAKGIVIPIFPTVYTPTDQDYLYYNAILESEIEQGDKVLVIGAGSGSDAWVASLKSHSRVYVIEINPVAISNINNTARIGRFQVTAILGDIRDVDLPEDFSQFDFVLWNMPFLEERGNLEERNFHDGDDGSILRSFLTLLPSLLKKDGQALILNTADALEFITFPNVTTKEGEDGNVLVYIFSIDAD